MVGAQHTRGRNAQWQPEAVSSGKAGVGGGGWARDPDAGNGELEWVALDNSFHLYSSCLLCKNFPDVAEIRIPQELVKTRFPGPWQMGWHQSD